jgi:predicted GNAT family N-acyltransferase
VKLLKQECHFFFDKLWRSRLLSRNSAYKWLAAKLEIAQEVCHISMLDRNQLIKSIELSKEYLDEHQVAIGRRSKKREFKKRKLNERLRDKINRRRHKS